MGALECHTHWILCLTVSANAKCEMRGRKMAAGYSQGLCFIPGARVGPVPINANFYTTNLQALLNERGSGRGGGDTAT